MKVKVFIQRNENVQKKFLRMTEHNQIFSFLSKKKILKLSRSFAAKEFSLFVLRAEKQKSQTRRDYVVLPTNDKINYVWLQEASTTIKSQAQAHALAAKEESFTNPGPSSVSTSQDGGATAGPDEAALPASISSVNPVR